MYLWYSNTSISVLVRNIGICFAFLIISMCKLQGQEPTKLNSTYECKQVKINRHFIAINPIKPFIGLPNLNYEFQIRRRLGLTAFSEVLAYHIISNFNHPDIVSTIGFSYYPFMAQAARNQGFFINGNTSYISYFSSSYSLNSLANGIQLGYKGFFKKSIYIEPKLVFNYVYESSNLLPGFELLLGLNI